MTLLSPVINRLLVIEYHDLPFETLKIFSLYESFHRYGRTTDVETKTNPIDRTVAHLLFHRPLELTENHSDKLESPISAKIQFESKKANLDNFPVECLPNEDLTGNQQFSTQGLEHLPEEPFKNSHCIDTSENACDNEVVDAGDQVLEASQ